MRVAWIAFALAAALAVQTTLVEIVAGTGAPLDLVLMVVMVVAIVNGPRAGLWTGTFGGLLQDALSGGVIGVGGLAKTVVGYLGGQVAAQFMVTRLWHKAMVFVGGSLLHAALFVGGYRLLFEDRVVVTQRDLLMQAAANTVVGLVVAVGLQTIPDEAERQRLRGRWPGGRHAE
jgi:rod shape-determining protein MreD